MDELYKMSMGDFSRLSLPVEEYNLPHIKSVALIDKVRVVNALIGFSRINPAMNDKDNGFVCVKSKETNCGIGLWQVRKILSKHSNLNLFTAKDDQFFIQQLEIYCYLIQMLLHF